MRAKVPIHIILLFTERFNSWQSANNMAEKIHTGSIQYIFISGERKIKINIDPIKATMNCAQIMHEDPECINNVQELCRWTAVV